MSVTPGFDGVQIPGLSSVAAEFRTAFISNPAQGSNVLNQYAIPPPAPIAQMSKTATKLVRYAEAYPEPQIYYQKYEGPYPNLSFAYGK
jgi:hypothetical protein